MDAAGSSIMHLLPTTQKAGVDPLGRKSVLHQAYGLLVKYAATLVYIRICFGLLVCEALWIWSARNMEHDDHERLVNGMMIGVQEDRFFKITLQLGWSAFMARAT